MYGSFNSGFSRGGPQNFLAYSLEKGFMKNFPRVNFYILMILLFIPVSYPNSISSCYAGISDMDTDRLTYTKIFEKRLANLERGLDQLRNSVKSRMATIQEAEWNKDLAGLYEAYRAAESSFTLLKASTDQNWLSVKSINSQTFDSAERALASAYKKFLPEKEAYQRVAQLKVDQAEWKIDILEIHLHEGSLEEQANRRAQLNKLKQHHNASELLLNQILGQNENIWKEMQKDLDTHLNQL